MPTFAGLLDEDEICQLMAYSSPLACEPAPETPMSEHRRRPPQSLPASRDAQLPADGHTLRSWLFTTDHKRIAILYCVSITFFFFVGGVAAALIRLELFTPQGDLLTRRRPTTGSSRSTASSWCGSS